MDGPTDTPRRGVAVGDVLEPPVELCRTRPGTGTRKERRLIELHAEMTRLGIDDDLARIPAEGEYAADQFVETKLLRAADLDRAIFRRGNRCSNNRVGNILGSHRLDEMVRLAGPSSNDLFRTLADWNQCLIDTSLAPVPR